MSECVDCVRPLWPMLCACESQTVCEVTTETTVTVSIPPPWNTPSLLPPSLFRSTFLLSVLTFSIICSLFSCLLLLSSPSLCTDLLVHPCNFTTPSILLWPGENFACRLLRLPFHCHFTTAFHRQLFKELPFRVNVEIMGVNYPCCCDWVVAVIWLSLLHSCHFYFQSRFLVLFHIFSLNGFAYTIKHK